MGVIALTDALETRGIKLGIFNRENCERGENSLFQLVIKLIDIDQFGTKRKNRSETFSFFAHFASFVCPAEAQGAKEGG